YIDERSYDRYNEIIAWFSSLDADAVVASYDYLEPLLQDAFAEIGYPDDDFVRALLDAIDVLLNTPEIDGPLALNDDQVMYTYSDSALEALPPVQKQLLRTGPENVERVKAKLREFRSAFRNR